ncbi:heavy-metal-associated domain-containing protein [Nocardia salmonicida]|uniref:heavy-metal-associated domain-containing protein n=1 Tax=Nocardia salmonicida TaxID=53431 RepID=UPI00344907B7
MSTTTVVLRVEGMHCASCALLIDDALADVPGVQDTRTAKKTGTTTLVLDSTAATVDQIIATISALGYTATAV